LVNQSFRVFSSSWLATKKLEVSPSTMDFYTNFVEKFCVFLGEAADNGDMGEITREQILAFRNHEMETLGLAPRTINHDLKGVRMVFKAAKRDGLIPENPANEVKTVSTRGENKTRRPFSIDEIRAVLSVSDPEWKSMILFGLYTGARLANVATLTWQNIDLAAGEIRYIARKGQKSMILPLAGALAAHVETLPTSDIPDAPLHPRAYDIVVTQSKSGHLSNQFASLLAQAGLREKPVHRKTHGKGRGYGSGQSALSFHCLRHTAVTMLKEAGIPVAVVMELVGHDSKEMSQHYTHVGKAAMTTAAHTFPDFTMHSKKI
jgi:integrase